MAAALGLALLATLEASALAGCTIDLNKDYNASSPLFLDKATLDIVYPAKGSPQLLSFESGEDRLIHCLGGRLMRLNVSTNSTGEVSECQADKTFLSPAKQANYSFDEVSCAGSPQPIARPDERRKCSGNGLVVNVGYQVTAGLFKKILDLCHVNESATTLWAHATVPGVIGAYKSKDFNSPAFSKGAYFGNVLMSQVYPRSQQVQTFLAIFENDRRAVDRYLPQEGKARNYLVKGHLVARADLLYPAEQYSTYMYVNVLPMWQSINNGNWKSVEATVRRVAAALRADLEVWTGGIGTLRLAGREIHLAKDKRNASRPLVPVPKLLFKLVVRQARKREALAFVTANDPYLGEQLPEDYRICPELKDCDRFAHFKQKPEGYTYCCAYGDFMASPEVRQLGLPANLKNVALLKLF